MKDRLSKSALGKVRTTLDIKQCMKRLEAEKYERGVSPEEALTMYARNQVSIVMEQQIALFITRPKYYFAALGSWDQDEVKRFEEAIQAKKQFTMTRHLWEGDWKS